MSVAILSPILEAPLELPATMAKAAGAQKSVPASKAPAKSSGVAGEGATVERDDSPRCDSPTPQVQSSLPTQKPSSINEEHSSPVTKEDDVRDDGACRGDASGRDSPTQSPQRQQKNARLRSMLGGSYTAARMEQRRARMAAMNGNKDPLPGEIRTPTTTCTSPPRHPRVILGVPTRSPGSRQVPRSPGAGQSPSPSRLRGGGEGPAATAAQAAATRRKALIMSRGAARAPGGAAGGDGEAKNANGGAPGASGQGDGGENILSMSPLPPSAPRSAGAKSSKRGSIPTSTPTSPGRKGGSLKGTKAGGGGRSGGAPGEGRMARRRLLSVRPEDQHKWERRMAQKAQQVQQLQRQHAILQRYQATNPVVVPQRPPPTPPRPLSAGHSQAIGSLAIPTGVTAVAAPTTGTVAAPAGAAVGVTGSHPHASRGRSNVPTPISPSRRPLGAGFNTPAIARGPASPPRGRMVTTPCGPSNATRGVMVSPRANAAVAALVAKVACEKRHARGAREDRTPPRPPTSSSHHSDLVEMWVRQQQEHALRSSRSEAAEDDVCPSDVFPKLSKAEAKEAAAKVRAAARAAARAGRPNGVSTAVAAVAAAAAAAKRARKEARMGNRGGGLQDLNFDSDDSDSDEFDYDMEETDYDEDEDGGRGKGGRGGRREAKIMQRMQTRLRGGATQKKSKSTPWLEEEDDDDESEEDSDDDDDDDAASKRTSQLLSDSSKTGGRARLRESGDRRSMERGHVEKRNASQGSSRGRGSSPRCRHRHHHHHHHHHKSGHCHRRHHRHHHRHHHHHGSPSPKQSDRHMLISSKDTGRADVRSQGQQTELESHLTPQLSAPPTTANTGVQPSTLLDYSNNSHCHCYHNHHNNNAHQLESPALSTPRTATAISSGNYQYVPNHPLFDYHAMGEPQARPKGCVTTRRQYRAHRAAKRRMQAAAIAAAAATAAQRSRAKGIKRAKHSQQNENTPTSQMSNMYRKTMMGGPPSPYQGLAGPYLAAARASATAAAAALGNATPNRQGSGAGARLGSSHTVMASQGARRGTRVLPLATQVAARVRTGLRQRIPRKTFQIAFTRTTTSCGLLQRVGAQNTTRDLRVAFAELWRVPLGCLALYFNGKRLMDSATLWQSGVRANDVVDVFMSAEPGSLPANPNQTLPSGPGGRGLIVGANNGGNGGGGGGVPKTLVSLTSPASSPADFSTSQFPQERSHAPSTLTDPVESQGRMRIRVARDQLP